MTIASDVSARLRATRPEWLPQVFPAGRIERGMFLLGNANGDAGRSFPIPLDGRKAESLSDFGGERVGDDLDLYCRGTRLSMNEAIKELAARFGLNNGAPHNSTSTTAPPPPSPDSHSLVRNADATWRYYDADGRLVLVHCRRNKRDSAGKLVLDGRGKPKKDFHPLSWSGKGWETKWPDRIPLYSLAELLQRRDCGIVMVEGEKATDAARKLRPDMVATTWAGSDAGLLRTDWSPLRNRHVTIWPDADLNGVGAIKAQKAAELAQKAGAASVRIVNLPAGLPDSWDLADAMPADWSAATVAELIDAAPVVKTSGLEDETGPLGPEPPPVGDTTRTKPDKAGRLHLVHFDEITPRTISNALIKGLLGAGQLSVLYGASNVGKTFLALYLAMLVALGRKWRDRQVRQGGVVYVAAEGGFGISNRVAAFRQHHGITGTAPFAIVPCSVDMCSPDADTADLIELVLAAVERMGGPVSLIVIDTLSRALSGGNENDSADMGAFVKHADKLRLETGAHVMVIHHSGKDEARGARGHSLLRAAVDTELEVTIDAATKIAVMRPVKQRELPTDGEFVFTLDVVELGEDEDGDPVTSCVVKPSDAPATKTARMSPSSRAALGALQKAILDFGTMPPHDPNIPRNHKAVTEQQWRDYSYKAAVSGSDKQNSMATAFRRSARDLQKAGMIGIWNGWVWLAKTPSATPQDTTGQTRTCPPMSSPGTGTHQDRTGHTPIGVSNVLVSCPHDLSTDDLDSLAGEGL